jgi:hypothetical protein
MGDLLLVHVKTDDGVVVLGRGEPADAISVGTHVLFNPDGELVRFTVNE